VLKGNNLPSERDCLLRKKIKKPESSNQKLLSNPEEKRGLPSLRKGRVEGGPPSSQERGGGNRLLPEGVNVKKKVHPSLPPRGEGETQFYGKGALSFFEEGRKRGKLDTHYGGWWGGGV